MALQLLLLRCPETSRITREAVERGKLGAGAASVLYGAKQLRGLPEAQLSQLCGKHMC